MTLTADPRLRARKVAVARAAGRRRLVALGCGLLVVALVVSALVVLHSPLLSARVVRIHGAVHEGRAEILSVTGLGARPPLADVRTAADAAALERLPWVRRARVVDNWPTGVTVTLTERHPVAYVSLPGKRAALVDRTGRILSRGVPVPPRLVALAVDGSVGAPGADLRASAPALAVAAALPSSLVGRVAEVTTGGAGAELRLAGGPLVLVGRPSRLEAKLTALETILARVSLHGIRTIDVRVPGQPVLTR